MWARALITSLVHTENTLITSSHEIPDLSPQEVVHMIGKVSIPWFMLHGFARIPEGNMCVVICIFCGKRCVTCPRPAWVQNAPAGEDGDRMWQGMEMHMQNCHSCKAFFSPDVPVGPLHRPEAYGISTYVANNIDSWFCSEAHCPIQDAGLQTFVQNALNSDNWTTLLGFPHDRDWWDFFRILPATQAPNGAGFWLAPVPGEVRRRHLRICSELLDMQMIKHTLKCLGSIRNILHGGPPEINMNKRLSWLYWMMRVAATPSHKEGAGGVNLQSVLHLIFERLIEGEVYSIATSRFTDGDVVQNFAPDVVFGLLYRWLLYNSAGKHPNNLSTWRLFEIAVGQYCRQRYYHLHTSRISFLQREMAWWQSLSTQEKFY